MFEEPGVAKLRDQKRSYHCCSLFLTLFSATLIAFFVYYTIENNKYENDWNYNYDYQTYQILCGVFGGIFYLSYLIECCCSGTSKYLGNEKDIERFDQFIDRVTNSPPTLNFHIECYHYETRTRIVYYTDSNGNQQSRTETYTEKVVTFRGSETFYYNDWSDETGVVVGLEDYQLTRLKMGKTLLFADQYTEQTFYGAKNAFENMHKYRDTHHNCWWDMGIAGFKERVLIKRSDADVPACMSTGWYWAWSLLLLTWPYRMWFENLTKGRSVTIKKQIFVKSPGM